MSERMDALCCRSRSAHAFNDLTSLAGPHLHQYMRRLKKTFAIIYWKRVWWNLLVLSNTKMVEMPNFVKGALIVRLVYSLKILHILYRRLFSSLLLVPSIRLIRQTRYSKKNPVTMRTHLYLFLSRFRHLAIINY